MRSNLTPSHRAIRNLRLKRGLSVPELAAAAGITASALNRIEKGVRTTGPRMDTLRNLAAALEVSVEDLLEEVPAGEGAA